MANQAPIPVVVNGAAGKMGREVVKAVAQAEDMTLLGAIDRSPEHQGKDAGELAGIEALEIPITDQLEPMLAFASQDRQLGVMVDFTHPSTVYDNIRSAIAYGIRPVVGTTGLSPTQIYDLTEFADKASTGCLLIPNFSIGWYYSSKRQFKQHSILTTLKLLNCIIIKKPMHLAELQFKPRRCWQKWAKLIIKLVLRRQKNYQEREAV
jgi:4-hydroxy-tetrahydrodipicolinate reductase